MENGEIYLKAYAIVSRFEVQIAVSGMSHVRLPF